MLADRGMPRNVWLLMAAQALNQCCAPMVVLVGGLVGSQLAPMPQLVTLPVALMVVGQFTVRGGIATQVTVNYVRERRDG